MIKCIYEECQWPECEKTCGLVPAEENYPVGASLEEGLIYHLQGRIGELKAEIAECHRLMTQARINARQIDRALITPTDFDNYPRACKYGYLDCVCDPGYIRKHYPDWWKDLGMPTTCDECKDGSGYDDEDK